MKLQKIIVFVVVVCVVVFSVMSCNHYMRLSEHADATESRDGDSSEADKVGDVDQIEIVVEPTSSVEEDVDVDAEGSEVKEDAENDATKNTSNTDNKNESVSTAIVKEPESITNRNEPKLVSLGEFKLTAYCNCSTCCGKWAGGTTASGVMPRANHTIAVDKSVIPFGTEVVINGIIYVAEDTGGAIKGNRIDIYMASHSEALQFGVRYAEVFIVVD